MTDAVRSEPAAAEPAGAALRLPNLLVRNRNFVLLWCAYGVAAIGDHLSEIALLKERNALVRPDGTRVQALITFGFFLPFVLLGPFAGWCSDRFSRKWIMIIADLLRAALVFNLATIVSALARWLQPHGLGDWSIVLPLAVVGAIAAFFSPARQAMLPTLIREDQLVRANALINALGTIGTIISAVVGGYLVVAAGPVWNFHINAGTFVLSAMFVSLILMSRTRAVPHPPLVGMWAPVRDGFRYVWTHRRVMQLIMLGAVFWAAAGIVISVIPAIVKAFYGEDYAAAGTFRGIIGIGLATGAAFMTIVGPALPPQLAILGALLGATLWLTLLMLTYTLGLGKLLTGVSLFGIGGAGAALLVTIMASIQRFVPDSRRGRVFGVSDMCTMGAMVAATGALGLPEIPNLDLYIPYVLSATTLVFIATLVLVWRDLRRHNPHGPLDGLLVQIVGFIVTWFYRLRRDGVCTIPRTGGVLVAANHGSGVDPIAIQTACPARLISYLVAKEHYEAPFWGWFMRRVHCIPVDRENPGKSFFAGCLRALKAGRCIGIFPQGTFEEPGKPLPEAKPGAALVALRARVPVVPCHISGTQYEDNPFKSLFLRHKVRIRFGPPIDLSPFWERGDDRTAAEEATALIMSRIRALAPDDSRAALEPASPGAGASATA